MAAILTVVETCRRTGIAVRDYLINKNEVLRGWIHAAEFKAKVIGEAKGRAARCVEMLRGLLLSKLGQLQKWTNQPSANADKTQIERWADKILTTQSLKGVIGRKY